MKYIVFSFAILCTLSCTRIVFNAPQPPNADALKEFPIAYQGTYLAPESAQDTMIIAGQTAKFIEFVSHTIQLADFDDYPNITLHNGLLYDADQPELAGLPYIQEDSSISYSYYSTSVIGLSDSLVIKQGKDYLVANARFESDNSEYWDAFLLRLNDARDLVVSGIGNLKTPEDTDESEEYDGAIADFTSIVPFEKIEDDTYLVSPNESQFVRLVKKGLFSSDALYQRVK